MKTGEIIGNIITEEREQNCPQFCLPRCYIGLEYEWENVQHFSKLPQDALDQFGKKLVAYYDMHSDGSLRGYSVEFVFRGPYAGTKLYNAIEAMDEAARVYSFKGSYRTSLHVHLDMNSTTFPTDIYKLAVIYAIAEPFIYKYIGKGREGCNYCVPWYLNSQHYEMFLSGVLKSANKPNHLQNTFVNSKPYKYSGLNFFSLGDFGTVEFRHGAVDMQMAKIIQWINIIMRMKKYVLETRSSSVMDIIDEAGKYGPQLFMKLIFQEESYSLLRGSKCVPDDFQIGLKTAYHFISLIP